MAQGFGRAKRRRQQLEQRKDRLADLNAMIPWESFKQRLDEQLHPQQRKSNAGRKPIDLLLLFKMLILQQLYNLSDEETEYQTHDRASFRRFVGLSAEAEVPDEKTLWLFRKRLSDAGLIDGLFEQFELFLRRSGYAAQGGQIVDATFIPVPIQRNSRQENEQIKAGETPAEWEDEPHKLAQKDTDARWTKKNGSNHFGYKDHINIDVTHGIIRAHEVTAASVHDSVMFCAILDGDNSGDRIWGDSAYRSEDVEWGLEVLDYDSQIHERGYRNTPLSETQQVSNREKSKIRSKVEHVFGAWVTMMGGKLVRCIGIKQVKAYQGLRALTYNLQRYVFLQKQQTQIA